MKILIADDIEENLYLLETVLKGNGYEVVSAKNGVEALEKLKKEPVDMIISDILMPKMDGFRLCSECKSDAKLKKIPFVFYTATYKDEKSESLALSMGAQKFIVKPMEPKNFMKIIKDLLKEYEKGILILPKIPAKKEAADYLEGYDKILIMKLEKKVLDLEKARDVLNVSEMELKERMKELNCLYGMSKIVEIPDISLEEIFQKMAAVIPPGWQYPDITCARIIVDGQEFKTTNFKETKWKQSANIRVNGKKVGVAEVYYLKKKPEIDEGPFLKEERNLIEAVAKRLGRITEHKRAEDALIESEEKLKKVFESSPDAITVSDLKGNITNCNKATLDMHGFSTKEELIGRSAIDLIAPEDHQMALENMTKTQKQGFVKNLEYTLLTKDGRKFPAELSASVIPDASGKPAAFVAITKDITERKNAEKKMREFVYKVNDISPGECYLHSSRDATYMIFAQLVLHGVPGLCISREKPEKLIEYGVLKENVILLSSTPIKGFKVIENLQEISRVISNFLKEHKTPIVLLDGLAYLVSRFDFKPVYKFIQEKRFNFIEAGATLIIPVDLATFTEKERALLTSEVKLLG